MPMLYYIQSHASLASPLFILPIVILQLILGGYTSLPWLGFVLPSLLARGRLRCSGVSRILQRGVLDDMRAKRARKFWRPHPLLLATPTIFAHYWVCIIKNRPPLHSSPLKNHENVQVSSY